MPLDWLSPQWVSQALALPLLLWVLLLPQPLP